MNSFSNYAEINTPLNYNSNVPSTYSNQHKYINNNNDSQSFSKNQDNMGFNGNNYYCGGNSKYAIGGMLITSNPVSILFFSDENIERLQKNIKKEVYIRTNKKFNLTIDQNPSDLMIAMRAIYLEWSKNYSDNVIRQVKELNKLTIENVVPDMITNIKQQIRYMHDIDNQPVPLPLPKNVNTAGRKTLPSLTSPWGF